MTLTEGGYNIDDETHAFRLQAPDIVHDLAHPAKPRTAFGFVAEALSRRRDAGMPPFTILSCDNLRHNGDVAKIAFISFARARDPSLAAWMEAEIDFPNSMVDRITPATTDADRARLNAASGVEDEIPVFAEDFIQWVMQDHFRYDGAHASRMSAFRSPRTSGPMSRSSCGCSTRPTACSASPASSPAIGWSTRRSPIRSSTTC